MDNRTRLPGSAIFGLILIAFGVISLMGELDYFNSWDIFSTYWPVILIAFGIKSMVDYRNSTGFGLILTAIGALFLIDNLNLMIFSGVNTEDLIIPVIIILIGLNFILPKRRRDDREWDDRYRSRDDHQARKEERHERRDERREQRNDSGLNNQEVSNETKQTKQAQSATQASAQGSVSGEYTPGQQHQENQDPQVEKVAPGEVEIE